MLFFAKLRNPETLEESIAALHKHLAHYEKELADRKEGPFFGGKWLHLKVSLQVLLSFENHSIR